MIEPPRRYDVTITDQDGRHPNPSRGLIGGWNCDDADDLADRVRADDAGSSGRCCLLGRHGELGTERCFAAPRPV